MRCLSLLYITGNDKISERQNQLICKTASRNMDKLIWLIQKSQHFLKFKEFIVVSTNFFESSRQTARMNSERLLRSTIWKTLFDVYALITDHYDEIRGMSVHISQHLITFVFRFSKLFCYSRYISNFMDSSLSRWFLRREKCQIMFARIPDAI